MKIFAIDTVLYSADIHTSVTGTTIVLDHSLEDSTDSTTTCDIPDIVIPTTSFIFVNIVRTLFYSIPELDTLITSPPPRA